MTPKTSGEFDAMFSTNAHITAARINGKLVGMAFLDAISPSVHYLRVICVHPSYRRRGVAIRLAQELLDQCRAISVKTVSFVSESTWIEKVLQEAGFITMRPDLDGIPQDLLNYNPSISRVKSDFTIDNYYELTTGEYAKARLFVMETSCG